ASYYAIGLLGVPPIAGVVVAMVALFLFGVVFERLVLTPMYSDKVERKDEYAIIVTFGLTILLTNLGLVVFVPFSKSPPAFLQGTLIAGPLILPYDRLIAAVIAVVILSGLAWFLARTSLGQALDAVSQSRDSAAVIGINPKRMYTIAFGLGSALAGGAGRSSRRSSLSRRTWASCRAYRPSSLSCSAAWARSAAASSAASCSASCRRWASASCLIRTARLPIRRHSARSFSSSFSWCGRPVCLGAPICAWNSPMLGTFRRSHGLQSLLLLVALAAPAIAGPYWVHVGALA